MMPLNVKLTAILLPLAIAARAVQLCLHYARLLLKMPLD
jgi:hypothetical protein